MSSFIWMTSFNFYLKANPLNKLKTVEIMLFVKSDKTKSKPLPSLSENTFLRYFTFAALYVAQGIPEGLLRFAIPAWLAMNGKGPIEIGSYVAVVNIPWSLKIINAPIMDRFTFLAMGRRRPWILFGQLGLILSFLSMSLISDPLNNLSVLMIMGFIVSFFEVSQDIAVDGMAIDILPVDQQARANGLMWGSKTLRNFRISSRWQLDNESLRVLLCDSIILINYFHNYSCSFVAKRKTGRKITSLDKRRSFKSCRENPIAQLEKHI